LYITDKTFRKLIEQLCCLTIPRTHLNYCWFRGSKWRWSWRRCYYGQLSNAKRCLVWHLTISMLQIHWHICLWKNFGWGYFC